MMIKKKSNPWARLKYLYVLPLAAVAVAAFARPEVSNEFNEISSVKVNDLASIVKADEVKSVENSSDEKFTLNGYVMTYPDKKPVPGASVIIRGTTDGTLADKDGKFQLPVKKGDVIIVSYVGLQTQQLQVPDQSNVNLVVWMKEDVQQMEEMVVVGYASDGVGAPTKNPDKKVEAVVDIPNVKHTEVKVDETGKEKVVFQVVEQMPEFPGGMGEAMKFLAKNIKYPVAAQQAKIEGRVIVQFVVGKDGSISDVHTVRSVSPELDAEAIRVVSMMPKWNPGKQRGKAVPVSYTMPIMFRLQGPTPRAKEEKPTDSHQISLKVDKGANLDQVYAIKDILKRRWAGSSLIVTNDINESPLVIVDGKEMGVGIDVMKEIPVDQIKTISVMKSEKDALAQYGDKAKDGVIMIVTKNNQQ